MALCSRWLEPAGCQLCRHEDFTPGAFERALDAASWLLYRVTGYQWPGLCTDEVRPCTADRTVFQSIENPVGDGSRPIRPLGSRWWGDRACDCTGDLLSCGCNLHPAVLLPGTPVVEIVEVLIDGAAFDDWSIVDDRWLLRTDGNRWPCFPAGTSVLTESGLKPIETVQPGERVLTHKNRWRKVLRSGKTGESETVQVAGRGGVLRSTPDHRMWASEVHGRPGQRKLGQPDWVQADELVGHAWAMPRDVEPLPLELPNVEELPPHFWWLAGRYVADGHCHNGDAGGSHQIRFSVGYHKTDEFEQAIEASGLPWRARDERTARVFSITSAPIRSWLLEQFGHGAQNKRLPAWLLGASELVRAEFLAGYVSGDGWVNSHPAKGRPFTSVKTVSRDLALGIKLLAAGLGYAPCYYEGKQTTTEIEGRQIGSVATTYRVDWPSVRPGEPYSQAWADDSHLWGRVRTVELDEDIVPVYDLEVEEDQSFIADGFVVHNCCQDLKEPATEPGTWQVTYSYGAMPPADGIIAAEVLACELAKSWEKPDSSDCKLPRRLTQMTRESVTVATLDPFQFLDDGRFGLYEVDTFIMSVLGGRKPGDPGGRVLMAADINAHHRVR